MQYSNLTEYLSETALRKKLGGVFCGPDESRYSEAGFYPVEYEQAIEFQGHDKASAYRQDNKIIVPAEDIALTDAVGKAIMMLIGILETAEQAGASVTLNGETFTMPLSANAKALYEANDRKNDGKTRRWIKTNGLTVQLTSQEFKAVFDQVASRIDEVYSNYATYAQQMLDAQTVAEIRTIMAGVTI